LVKWREARMGRQKRGRDTSVARSGLVVLLHGSRGCVLRFARTRHWLPSVRALGA